MTWSAPQLRAYGDVIDLRCKVHAQAGEWEAGVKRPGPSSGRCGGNRADTPFD